MRSGNPALNENTFLDVGSGQVVSRDPGQVMTLNGTVNKTGLLLLILVATAAYTWNMYTGPESLPGMMPYLWGGMIGGFVIALVTVFKKEWSPVTAPLYAAAEGLFVGAVSVWFEARSREQDPWWALTNGVLVSLFGVRHLGMLSGAVFFSHQVGGFLGVWLGGVVFEMTKSYDLIWIAAMTLGLVAAALHFPIDDCEIRHSPPQRVPA